MTYIIIEWLQGGRGGNIQFEAGSISPTRRRDNTEAERTEYFPIIIP